MEEAVVDPQRNQESDLHQRDLEGLGHRRQVPNAVGPVLRAGSADEGEAALQEDRARVDPQHLLRRKEKSRQQVAPLRLRRRALRVRARRRRLAAQPAAGTDQKDLQRHLRRICGWMQLESNFDVDNYNKSRADLKKGFTEFFNLMKTHIKKSFKIIFEEKLLLVLQPFSDLLEINMKLSLHELKYTTKEEQFVNQFKYDAIVDRYCVCL